MKILYKLLFAFAIVASLKCSALAQNTTPVADLMKQGVELHNQGKYADAIDKFNEVIKTDPENEYAHYEIAFSLYAAKKPNDAIPHINKAVKSTNTSLSVAAYCLLASIYDESKQSQKAIETYNTVIKINPDYPQIYYNLGIAYFRAQQYTEAENSAIEAIKHNPKNASSQRLYALVTFHQNKRANALLGFCSFLLLEPTGARAAEAIGNLQHIIQGGVLKDANGNTAIAVSTKDDKETGTLNLGISLSVQAAQLKKLTGADLLEYELKSIFALCGQLAEKKTDKSFFDRFFAAYFYKLAQSSNISAFSHAITTSANPTESSKWATANAAQINSLNEWVKNTERGF